MHGNCLPNLDHIDPTMLESVLSDQRQRLKEKLGSRSGSASDRRPVSCWTEKELLDGDEVAAFVVVLRTHGCRWAWTTGGCSMCGYITDCSASAVDTAALEAQLEHALQRYNGEPFVKFFCSGSFFDPDEIPLAIQHAVLDKFGTKARRLTLETRPEHIDATTLEAYLARAPHDALDFDLEIAIGLESSDPAILERSVHKGITLERYRDAARTVREAGALVKTYVLLKPPFLTEAQAIEDAVATVANAAPFSETISLNPVNVQNFTFIEHLYRAGQYRPPWLWSVVEVLEQSAALIPSSVRLMSAPTAGGTKRGAHNCYRCDHTVLRAIEAFSLGYGTAGFDAVECDCREQWYDVLEFEDIALASKWGP